MTNQCELFESRTISGKMVKPRNGRNAEWIYAPSVIGSGFEEDVSKLALADGIAKRAARKNMQIHSAIILKIDGEFAGFFTFQNNDISREFCLLQSVIQPHKHTTELYAEMVRQVIARNKHKYPAIITSGDPSEDWNHTFDVLGVIQHCNTEIVIITRHWTLLTAVQLRQLARMNICINTSVSALDSAEARLRSLAQYERIKPHCKSVLRIVSCDFNLENEIGKRLARIQNELFQNEAALDTVFRPSKNNPFVLDGVINVRTETFNGGKCLASKRNRKTYMGRCNGCHEMCGVNMTVKNVYLGRPGVLRQMLFQHSYWRGEELIFNGKQLS